MKTAQLLNYAFDRWTPGEGDLAELASAIDGAPVAMTGSGGLDFARMLRHAREVGGPALRKMTFHERAWMLKALGQAIMARKEELYELNYLTGATRKDGWIDIEGGAGTLCSFSSTRSRELPDAHVLMDGALEPHKTLRREVHKILQQADYDLKRIQYNTVVSAAMKMLNTLESSKLDESAVSSAVIAEGYSIFLRVLYPVAPHITHALWEQLGYATVYGDILDAKWPEVDPAALEQAEIEMMIQVNGKLRGSVTVPKGADKAAIEAAALASEAVQKFVEGTPKKVIVVPGKLVNIVA